MALGFSVDSLLGKARGGGTLRMGLVRLAPDEWLRPSPELGPRAAVFDAHPEAVAVMPEARAAEAELSAMLGVSGLEAAARAHWEDFCLLTPSERGEGYRLAGGALGFPTDWRLEDKLGLALTAVHAPIHGYAEQLAQGVDSFMEGLSADAIFGRANWFVIETADWRYLPSMPAHERFAHVTVENAGETLFVRCERQTLRRLPETGAIVFTIGIHVSPLGELSDANVARIAASVAAIPGGERERRSAPFYAEALAQYAALRASSLTKTGKAH